MAELWFPLLLTRTRSLNKQLSCQLFEEKWRYASPFIQTVTSFNNHQWDFEIPRNCNNKISSGLQNFYMNCERLVLSIHGVQGTLADEIMLFEKWLPKSHEILYHPIKERKWLLVGWIVGFLVKCVVNVLGGHKAHTPVTLWVIEMVQGLFDVLSTDGCKNNQHPFWHIYWGSFYKGFKNSYMDYFRKSVCCAYVSNDLISSQIFIKLLWQMRMVTRSGDHCSCESNIIVPRCASWFHKPL